MVRNKHARKLAGTGKTIIHDVTTNDSKSHNLSNLL